jgi:GH25 family lysozyme M1 (1,4-beta-N-acetylmuramidase)
VAAPSAEDLLPPLDVGDVNPGSETPAEFNNAIRTWLNTVQQALGVRPLLYTSKSGWGMWNGGDTTFGADGYPLWVADFGAASPALPQGWSNWAFWQYNPNGAVPGISVGVDEDYFNAGFNGGNLCTVTVSSAELATPANTAAPQITGTPVVRQPLMCTEGSWSGVPDSFSYQ